jgi:predicted nucleotidyltransferase
MNTLSEIQPYLDDVLAWAAGQADIIAVALVGSYARNAAKDTSDIDLVLIVEDPQKYLSDTAWAGNFGEIAKQQLEDYGKVTSLRIWYANGREVEYGLSTRAWVELPLDKGTQQVIGDGLKVLFEREPVLSPFEKKT